VLPSRNCTVPVAAGFTFTVKVTVCPVADGFGLETRLSPGLSFTLCETAAEVEPALPASPLYTAVMECVPCVRAEVLKDAEPLASVDVPSTVLPSRNCTVPVAVEGVTPAINVTAPPTGEGFWVEVKAVVVVDLGFTVCVIAAEVKLK
jgi:hypothetical protein